MVAKITDSTTGEPLGIHRTFLAPDGKGKAPVDQVKMMLGPSKGGVARLGEPEDDGVLMIGEGIETCLSVMQVTGHPAWAALSAGGLRDLELPPENYEVIILADSDKVGESSAQAAAIRWVEERQVTGMMAQEKRHVSIARPPPGKDFNDLLREPNGKERITSIIDNAEEIKDPLDGLLEKTRKDPGAPFEPKVIDAILRRMKQPDGHAWFERLRSNLKTSTSLRVTELDKLINKELDISKEPTNKKLGIGKKPTQVEILENIVNTHEEQETLEAFRPTNDLKESYVNVIFMLDEIDEMTGNKTRHRKTFGAPSHDLSLWLTNEFFKSTGKAPNADTLKTVMNRLEATAKNEQSRYSIFIRVGYHEEKFYLDLGDETWGAIEIDDSGWQKFNEPPICFRRTDGMTPLPDPTEGDLDDCDALEKLSLLRSFLNLKSEEDFVLVVCWLLTALRPKGPYPVLVLSGEQGTAKSTFARIMRALIDPNKAPLRSLPREDGDLIVAAHNSHTLVFDNVSEFSGDISDALCRIATGSGHGKRKLYTDNTEVIFDGSRPIILNGITDIVTRSDLADRAITVTLEPIPPENRRLEKDLWEAFDKVKPRILVVLLDAMVVGLKRLPEIPKPKELPRMADFAFWSIACETAFWAEGTFNAVFEHNYSRTLRMVLDNDDVSVAVQNLMEEQRERTLDSWEGTATELLNKLETKMPSNITRSVTWPKGPPQLSRRLNRLQPTFREIGIAIETGNRKGHQAKRVISIRLDSSYLKSSDDCADSADGENDLLSGTPKKGTTSALSIPLFLESQTIEKTPSAPSASSQNGDNKLIYKGKHPEKMLTVPLTVPQMLTVTPSAKTANETNFAVFDEETSNADGKTGVADGMLTVGTVSNLPPFCGACTHFEPDPKLPTEGKCNAGVQSTSGRFLRWSRPDNCHHFKGL